MLETRFSKAAMAAVTLLIFAPYAICVARVAGIA